MNLSPQAIFLASVLSGDEVALKEIYRTVFPRVVRFINANKGDRSEAEEIFQEALYQILIRTKINSIQIKSSFDAYLFSACRNLWYKELNKRKKKVRIDGLTELKEKEDDRLMSIISQERWDLYEEMFSKLNEKCKTLLKDYFNKVPYSVIVDKFSYASENAAFQRVFKCKKHLMNLIKSDSRYKNLCQNG